MTHNLVLVMKTKIRDFRTISDDFQIWASLRPILFKVKRRKKLDFDEYAHESSQVLAF